jgi:hypothetical protein
MASFTSDEEGMRLRIMEHEWGIPATVLFLRMKHFLKTVETVMMEGWMTYVAFVWGYDLLLGDKNLFAIAPQIFGTMAYFDESLWGIFAWSVVVLPLLALVKSCICIPRFWNTAGDKVCIKFRPRTWAPLWAAVFFAAMAGCLAAQSTSLPGVKIWAGQAVVCIFIFWRRMIED